MARKKSPKPWDTRWEAIDKLGGGGEGTTYLVRDRETAEPGVLKVQNYGKAQKDPERRGRFRREAVALETLDHPRIPKLLHSNADKYRDPDVDLFMVQEHVEGTNLADYIEANGPISTDLAIELTRALVEALAYCHGEEIGHRDVKPDNIVLRGNDPIDPVLVDFGQSFPAGAVAGSMVTYDEQVMGNRFLVLPELTSGTGKRDFRSDLTHLAGVLLFSVTGILPMQLLDGDRNRPHRQPEAATVLAATDRGDLLGWFFDQAFRYRPSARFQDHAEFGKALDYVADGGDLPLSAILARGKQKLEKSADLKALENITQLWKDIGDLATKAGKVIHAEMAGIRTRTIPNGVDSSGEIHSGRFSIEYGIAAFYDADISAIMIVDVRQQGDVFEITVHPRDGGRIALAMSTSVFEPLIPPDFRDRLARVLALELARVMA